MPTNTDNNADADTDIHLDDPASLQDRFERAIRGVEKPKSPLGRRPFQGITSDERRKRELLISECVHLGMSAEQIVDFLPTWGVALSRSQVYEYLGELKLPRFYRKSESEQSHHDYFIFRFFIRFAQDAAEAGFRTKELSKGTAVEGMRFRPDFRWKIGHYLFFKEMQLSDLTETRWTVKFANYYRLYETGLRFRALFIIDQKGDLSYIRRTARRFLERKGRPDLNLFQFISLDDMKGSRNLAVDAVWMKPDGERIALLQWLTLPGQKPPAQR